MNKGSSLVPPPPPPHTHRRMQPCLGPRQTEWLRCLTVDPDGIRTWWRLGRGLREPVRAGEDEVGQEGAALAGTFHITGWESRDLRNLFLP